MLAGKPLRPSLFLSSIALYLLPYQRSLKSTHSRTHPLLLIHTQPIAACQTTIQNLESYTEWSQHIFHTPSLQYAYVIGRNVHLLNTQVYAEKVIHTTGITRYSQKLFLIVQVA
jgi:hypothetical protein